jgi:hypothetical protein
MDHSNHPHFSSFPQAGGYPSTQASFGTGQGIGPGQSQHQQAMGYHAYPSYPTYPGYNTQNQQSSGLLGFSNDRFLKGLLIGAAATYLLTNENVQRGLIKGTVKVWSLLQGGVEEMKERFHDAEAEIRAEAAE